MLFIQRPCLLADPDFLEQDYLQTTAAKKTLELTVEGHGQRQNATRTILILHICGRKLDLRHNIALKCAGTHVSDPQETVESILLSCASSTVLEPCACRALT